MRFFKINSDSDFNALCDYINPHKTGRKIMALKSKLNYILIKDITQPAANILKQEALSIGAELVCSHEVIIRPTLTNALLMGHDAHLARLATKLLAQDFALKDLGEFLKLSFKREKTVKLMSIINLNNDSFYENSRVSELKLGQIIEEHLKLGADFIDLGAVSSRPGSFYVGGKEEYERLKYALDFIKKQGYYEKSIFSLDSFDINCVKMALDCGFLLINDISGLKNPELLDLAKTYQASYLLMHMQNEPHNMQVNPYYEDVLASLEDFFKNALRLCDEAGVKKVIIDPGFGFGKELGHNLSIIKHLEHFLQFQKPILVGASRKGSVSKVFKSEVKDRLAGSLAFHAAAFKNGASIIRTHDLYEHKQFFAVLKALDESNVF